jgi:long-chain fatty acid transport protein
VKRNPIFSHGRDGIALIAVLVTVLAGTAQAQGIALDGAGPINRSMGGAATAAPIDSIGALLWNPGSIGGLPTSELAFGFEALLPTEEVSSSIAQGALGGGFPPVALAGSTQGEPGITPIPSMAWVHKVQDSRWTCGLGMFGIAGFSANYPASLTNPILFPQNNQPGGFGGLGHVAADAQYFQIVPTCCYALTNKLSVGFGPTVTLGRVTATPLSFVAPDDADGSLVARYPVSATTRYSWGGGFQLGAYYVTDAAWQFGFSFKSPQWFEPYHYNAADEVGGPRREVGRFDYPMILSLGTAYTGFEKWLLACDVRYFDYHNTAGYGDPAGFDATGAMTGLGWQSVASVHLGAQYQATQRLYLRMGYEFNGNPIGSDEAFFNVASPLIIQHVVSTGFSYHMTDQVSLSLAYVHGFENSVTGPIQIPGVGPLVGTSVTNKISADAISAGVAVRY